MGYEKFTTQMKSNEMFCEIPHGSNSISSLESDCNESKRLSFATGFFGKMIFYQIERQQWNIKELW